MTFYVAAPGNVCSCIDNPTFQLQLARWTDQVQLVVGGWWIPEEDDYWLFFSEENDVSSILGA